MTLEDNVILSASIAAVVSYLVYLAMRWLDRR